MTYMRLKTGTILIVIILIFVTIVFLGISTLKTINHVENYAGSELHETFRQATKLLLDSDEFLLRFRIFLDEPGADNYAAVTGALEMLYLRVGVIEKTLVNSSSGDFSSMCLSIYAIYDEMSQILDGSYAEIVLNSIKLNQLYLDTVNIGHEITHEADIIDKKNIENTRFLLIEAGNRILLFISVMIIAIIVIVLLLFEHSRMTQQLRVSESKFRAIFNESFQFFGQLDTDGNLIDINNTALKNYNISREDIINKPFSSGPWWGNDPELQKRLNAAIKKASGGETVRMDIVHKLSDGELMHVDFSLKPVFRDDGSVLMLIPEGRDITLMKKAEEELTVLQDYLTNIIDSMPSMIIGVDSEGIVTQWNETAFRNTGIQFKDAVGESLFSLIPGLSGCAVLIDESIKTQQVRYEKRRHSSLGNEGCYEDLIVYPLQGKSLSGAVVRIDDVTEFMKMNEMMIQSEKMLSVGGLAAGMAHEINNPLAGMMQSAEVVIERLSNENIPANLKAASDIGIKLSEIKSFMEKREILSLLSGIKDSGIRAALIIENMLNFSRKNDVAKSTHFIEDLLDRAIELSLTDYDLKKTYGFKKVKIIKHYQEDLPPIPCEGQKMLQVFLNILRNGAQAMDSWQNNGDGSENSEYNPEFNLGISLENEMIRIDFKDNGPGMPEEIRKRVFEPFFTTKPVGKGTGLGLSVSFFIVNENHQGQLSVESEEGKGARFIVRLPVS